MRGCIHFVVALELLILLKFTRGVIVEDYADSDLGKSIQKRASESILNNSTNIKNISIVSSTVDPKNMSQTKSDGKINNTVLNNTNANSYPIQNITNQNKAVKDLLNNITLKYPQAVRNVNNTLKSLGIIINDPQKLIELYESNITLHELQSSINKINVQNELDKTQGLANSDISKAILKHQAEAAMNDMNKAMSNTSLSGLSEQTTGIIRRNWNFTRGLPTINLTMLLDPSYNPNLWLMRMQAPWKHVSGTHTANQTEVVQVCKFDGNVATCSAQYSSWDAKAWFELAESPGRNGLNITVYERGHTPRVTFFNKVNGTDCQTFNNGSLHQVCVKIYGYDKDLGPTRVCLQFGAAIFNHGVASTDFGCFRFGSAVRHEDAMEGETPNPTILNRFILDNNYTNIRDEPVNGSISFKKNNFLWLVLAVFLVVFLER